MKLLIYIIFILFVVYIIASYVRERGYYLFYPSQSWLLPIRSKDEVLVVKNNYLNRGEQDKQDYYATDLDGVKLFYKVLRRYDVTEKEISNVFFSPKLKRMILMHKYLYNRVRPYQLDKTIKPPTGSNTYHTPSYPAGHVAQYYSVYKYFAPKYPKVEWELKELVETVDRARVRAGIHYPSDGVYARKMVDSHFSEIFV